MTDLSKAELLDLRITSAIASCEEGLFQRLDDLKKSGFNDEDVRSYLLKQGYTDYAEQGEEWAEMDTRPEGGNSALGEVPDPAGAESYKDHPLNQHKDTRQLVLEALIGQLSVERDQNDLWFDFNHLDEVVLDGRVDFQKLADAIVKAVQK